MKQDEIEKANDVSLGSRYRLGKARPLDMTRDYWLDNLYRANLSRYLSHLLRVSKVLCYGLY